VAEAPREEPRVVFFDIGGVLGTNGWDHVSRAKAAARFALDEGFEARHQRLHIPLDSAQITLDEYLCEVVFDRARAFSKGEFVAFMQSESAPFPEAIAVLAAVARARRARVFTLNNESRELNGYRIDKFGLAPHVEAFLSSCYLGLAKPDEAIYRRALEIVHAAPGECVFVDDRPENVAPAVALGLRGIRHETAAATREALAREGVIFG
jgi:putative hydrolase of the HAD superfamily